MGRQLMTGQVTFTMLGTDDLAQGNMLYRGSYAPMLTATRPLHSASKTMEPIPISFTSAMHLARELGCVGLHTLAERAARSAITLRPDSFDAHYALGTALRKQGRLHDALQA